ncbi:hypothetical protein D3C81_1144070 [compost metagenome]
MIVIALDIHNQHDVLRPRPDGVEFIVCVVLKLASAVLDGYNIYSAAGGEPVFVAKLINIGFRLGAEYAGIVRYIGANVLAG